jgi:hypothetical protein
MNWSKDSNGLQLENSTVEGGDLHTGRPEPTSGRELTNRRQNTTEDKQKSEDVRSEIFMWRSYSNLQKVIMACSYEAL